MKRLFSWQKYVQAEFSKIHIVDKCLLIFMLVLLAQSALSLFLHVGSGAENNNIDIIVRTSSAAIFGYFLSANFIKRGSASKNAAEDTLSSQTLDPETQPELDSEDTAPKEEPHFAEIDTEKNLQIIVATSIGLFCLISLLLLRDVVRWNPDLYNTPAAAATVAQFRDFVSGCVGFLIGCPTNKSN